MYNNKNDKWRIMVPICDWGREEYMKEKNGDIEECRRCGKMFVYSGVGKYLCPSCQAEDDAEFETVKEYIYDNLSATIMQVSKATGVKVSRIKSYLKDGRLIIPDSSAVFINCEICGTEIKYGRVCKSCADSLSNELKKEMGLEEYQVGEKPKTNEPAKMRFLNRVKMNKI